MRPFQASYPHFPNQNQSEGENKSSALPQVKMQNPNNYAPCNSQPHQNNPHYPVQLNNPNTYLSNGNGNYPSNHSPHLPNIANHHQLPMQNIQIAYPQSQFFSQNTVPQVHGHHQSAPQNGIMSQPCFANNRPQLTNMPFGQLNYHFPHHANQINGLSYGQFSQLIGRPQVQPFSMPPCLHPSMGSLNQGALPPGSQNVFLMNPQSVVANPNHIAQNTQGQNICIASTMGQNALQASAMNCQHIQKNSVPSFNNGHTQIQQTQNNVQSGVFEKSQGNHAKDGGRNISNISERNSQEKDFTRNKQSYAKRESRNMRFLKSNIHPVTNSKGNFRSFEGRGPNGKGSRNPHSAKCKQGAGEERQSPRSLPLNYTQEEIQKWREERRKNHPSGSNLQKKPDDQRHSESVDLDAQKRRQQLKEIIAKQAELGVEVAEIPKDYLLDSEKQANETDQNATSAEKRCKKRGGKRQKHGRFNRSNKKQKLEDNDSSPRPAMHKKNPTLLQKLFTADIKREKSQLLQAFRFMVLNNFFVDWPKKPVEFPSIMINTMASGSEPGKESSPYQGNGLVSTSEMNVLDNCKGLDEHDTSPDDVADTNNHENKIISHHSKETESFGVERSDGEDGQISE